MSRHAQSQFTSRLAALLLLLVTCLAFAVAAPVPEPVDKWAIYRDIDFNPPGQITFEEYVDYLKKNFSQTDKYIFYTGGSDSQAKEFQKHNQQYLRYYDLFIAPTVFKETFGDRESNLDNAAKAMGSIASGRVMVFGGIDYKSWENSVYTTKEDPELKRQMREGKVQSIVHMQKDALSPTQILATEDVHGKTSFINMADEGKQNANLAPGSGPSSGRSSPCRRSEGLCDQPRPYGPSTNGDDSDSTKPKSTIPQNGQPDTTSDTRNKGGRFGFLSAIS